MNGSLSVNPDLAKSFVDKVQYNFETNKGPTSIADVPSVLDHWEIDNGFYLVPDEFGILRKFKNGIMAPEDIDKVLVLQNAFEKAVHDAFTELQSISSSEANQVVVPSDVNSNSSSSVASNGDKVPGNMKLVRGSNSVIKGSSKAEPGWLKLNWPQYAIAGMSDAGGIYSQTQRFSTLYETLKGLRNEHVDLKRFVYKNDAADALNIITKYDATINKASSESGIPKEIIQAILYRELIFFSPFDATDVNRVKLGHATGLNKALDYLEPGSIPYKAIGYFDSASIGLGQIFPETAMKAEKYILGYQYNRDETFRRLQDDTTNIHYVALVLAYEADRAKINLNNGNREDIERLLAKYNGTGNEAVQYGRETYQYYEAFRKYNQ